MGPNVGKQHSDRADGKLPDVPGGGKDDGRRRSRRRRRPFVGAVGCAAVLVLVLLVSVAVVQRSGPGVAGSPLAAERIDTGFAGAVRIDDITVATAPRPSDDPAVAPC